MSLLALLLLACGGPTVAVTSGVHPEAARPAALDEVWASSFQRPIERCLEGIDDSTPLPPGEVRYTVVGSHGILKAEVEGEPHPALERCALEPMRDSRLMRRLGDGDATVGFTVTARYDPG